MIRLSAHREPCSPGRQAGFSIVLAIFLVVVLAALGMFVVQVALAQYQASNLELLGARTESAAQAGLQYATYEALKSPIPWCPAAPRQISVSLMPPALPREFVNVTCSATAHRIFIAGQWQTYYAYTLTSTATHGTYGAADYVSRTVWRDVTNAPP